MCANSKLSQQRGSPHSSVVAVGRPPDPGNSFEVEDAASHSSTGDVASDHSFLLFLLLLLLLLLRQHQKLCVGSQHFPNRVLKLPSGAHPAADLLGPLRGDAFHVALPVDHVGQGPSRVPLATGTPAGGLSAARITPRQGSWKLVGRPGKMLNDFKLALAQARGVWRARLFPHLEAIVLQEQYTINH